MVRIMIVDDDSYLHKVLERILVIGGHEVASHAYNGAEAIEQFLEMAHQPDIVLMDHRMPVMNGATATKELIKINAEIKVIFISADESVQEEALHSGALDFLTKPIRAKAIFEVIDKYVS